MEYNDNQPIWLQIYDLMCARIAEGKYPAGERIPSIRELAVEMQVNPNTIVRVYERMESDKMIANRRGVGYFTTDTALTTINEVWRKEFIDNDVPQFIQRMEQFGVGIEEFNRLYQNIINHENKH